MNEIKARFKDLEGKVKDMLYWHPYTRNSDIDLWVEVIQRFYWSQWVQFLHQVNNFDDPRSATIALKTFMHAVPNQENIKRVRARWNERGKYYPTNRKIAMARRINQKKWLEALTKEGLKPDQILEEKLQENHIKNIKHQASYDGMSTNSTKDRLFHMPAKLIN